MFVATKEITMQEATRQSSTPQEVLGTLAHTKDGDVYAYGQAGASNIARARLVVNADLIANHTNIVVQTAAAVGATTVKATLGATAATEDQYRGGKLTVNDSAGEGYSYRIRGNSAADASGVITVYLDNAQGLIEALTTSSEVTLKLNKYAGLVISATDQADLPVGITRIAVTAAYYAWFQVAGDASVLGDASTMTKGVELTISAATAGAVGLKDAAGEAKVGVASEALVSTEHRAITFNLL